GRPQLGAGRPQRPWRPAAGAGAAGERRAVAPRLGRAHHRPVTFGAARAMRTPARRRGRRYAIRELDRRSRIVTLWEKTRESLAALPPLDAAFRLWIRKHQLDRR